MSEDGKLAQKHIDQLFSGPRRRAADWRDLLEAAKTWARGGHRVIRRTPISPWPKSFMAIRDCN
jgi:hypothetical protein